MKFDFSKNNFKKLPDFVLNKLQRFFKSMQKNNENACPFFLTYETMGIIGEPKTEEIHYFFLFLDRNNKPDFIVLIYSKYEEGKFIQFDNNLINRGYYDDYQVYLKQEQDYIYLDEVLEDYSNFANLKQTISSF